MFISDAGPLYWCSHICLTAQMQKHLPQLVLYCVSLCWPWCVVVVFVPRVPILALMWLRDSSIMQASLCMKPLLITYVKWSCLWQVNINDGKYLHVGAKTKTVQTVFSVSFINWWIKAPWWTVVWHMKHLFHQHPFFFHSVSTARRRMGVSQRYCTLANYSVLTPSPSLTTCHSVLFVKKDLTTSENLI